MKNLEVMRKMVALGIGNDTAERSLWRLCQITCSLGRDRGGRARVVKRTIRKLLDGVFNKSYISLSGIDHSVN